MNQHYQFNQQNTQKQYYYYSQVWKNQILMQSDKTSSIKSREADYTIQEARISKIQEPIHQNFKIPNFDSNGDWRLKKKKWWLVVWEMSNLKRIMWEMSDIWGKFVSSDDVWRDLEVKVCILEWEWVDVKR